MTNKHTLSAELLKLERVRLPPINYSHHSPFTAHHPPSFESFDPSILRSFESFDQSLDSKYRILEAWDLQSLFLRASNPLQSVPIRCNPLHLAVKHSRQPAMKINENQ